MCSSNTLERETCVWTPSLHKEVGACSAECCRKDSRKSAVLDWPNPTGSAMSQPYTLRVPSHMQVTQYRAVRVSQGYCNLTNSKGYLSKQRKSQGNNLQVLSHKPLRTTLCNTKQLLVSILPLHSAACLVTRAGKLACSSLSACNTFTNHEMQYQTLRRAATTTLYNALSSITKSAHLGGWPCGSRGR